MSNGMLLYSIVKNLCCLCLMQHSSHIQLNIPLEGHILPYFNLYRLTDYCSPTLCRANERRQTHLTKHTINHAKVQHVTSVNMQSILIRTAAVILTSRGFVRFFLAK